MDFNIKFETKLLERMWTTVEKCYFEPKIIVKVAKANIKAEDLKQYAAVIREEHIKLLKQNTANININELEKISTQDLKTLDQKAKDKIEPYLECYKNSRNELSENIIHREFRKEVNFANTVNIAADILSQDQSEPPREQVEQDWIDRFREVASNTSTEEIQQLWGRILAGEIKSPGKHSLRTLEFIKNLSKKEALQIENLYRFVFDDNFIVKGFTDFYEDDKDILNFKLLFVYFLDMQSLGLIQGVEGTISIVCSPVFIKEISFFEFKFRKYNGEYDHYYFTHNDKDKTLNYVTCALTKLGKELHDLCHIDVDEDYLNTFIESLKNRGYKKISFEEFSSEQAFLKTSAD